MKIVVTCGPGCEPIDRVRRITNSSTGRLGVTLANALAGDGHQVFCFKGDGATWPVPLRVHSEQGFSTNDMLAAQLFQLSRRQTIDFVFHAAALCDFKVRRVAGEDGATLTSAKFPTRRGSLLVELVPARKILPRLRDWFPGACIVGWKYELEGGRHDVLARALQQIHECRTDACIANGAAFGPGFGFVAPTSDFKPLDTLGALCQFLVQWVRSSGATSHEPGEFRDKAGRSPSCWLQKYCKET